MMGQNIQLKKTIPLQADAFIGVDQFENIFYVYDNIFYKNNTKTSYSNFQLGELTSVDISNPFKIVLFYKDFNSVVLLDNNLNQTDKITFEYNVSFVQKNIKNKLWLFNRDTNSLEVYNFKKNLVEFKTPPLTQKPISFQSNINNGYILSENDIQIIDYLGNLTNTIPTKEIESFQVFKKNIIALKNNKLHSYTSDKKKTFIYEDKEIVDFYFGNNDFYIFDGTKINHFRIDKKQ